MRVASTVLAVLAIAALGVAGAGCGGSSTTTTQTVTQNQGGAPTKAEYIKQVDAICAKYRPKRQQLQDEAAAISEPQTGEQLHQFADLLRRSADLGTRVYQQVRAVTPPAGDESIIDNWFSTANTSISLTRDYADAVDAAKGTNGSQARSLGKQISAYAAKGKGIAQGYDFEVCGSETG
jgi:hypothetical protein